MANLDAVVRLLKIEHARLSKQLQSISAALDAFRATYTDGAGGGRKISPAGRARIAAAQRARWAKWKGTRRTKKRGTMSAAG
jgi:hypothetical protein